MDPISSGVTTNLNLYGVWGTAMDNVWAVGATGTVLHKTAAGDGGWAVDASLGITQALYSVWGSSATDVWTVGDGGHIWHYDGAWTKVGVSNLPKVVNFRAVWGTSDSNLWVVGDEGTILRHTGTDINAGWTQETTDTSSMLWGVWGRDDHDVFAVGDNGAVLHWDGISWTTMDAGAGTVNLRGVWGSDEMGVFVYGWSSTLFRYDRTSWSTVQGNLPVAWYGMWGDNGLTSTKGFLTGNYGTILRFDSSQNP